MTSQLETRENGKKTNWYQRLIEIQNILHRRSGGHRVVRSMLATGRISTLVPSYSTKWRADARASTEGKVRILGGWGRGSSLWKVPPVSAGLAKSEDHCSTLSLRDGLLLKNNRESHSHGVGEEGLLAAVAY